MVEKTSWQIQSMGLAFERGGSPGIETFPEILEFNPGLQYLFARIIRNWAGKSYPIVVMQRRKSPLNAYYPLQNRLVFETSEDKKMEILKNFVSILDKLLKSNIKPFATRCIIGAPASGKTTYVKSLANSGNTCFEPEKMWETYFGNISFELVENQDEFPTPIEQLGLDLRIELDVWEKAQIYLHTDSDLGESDTRYYEIGGLWQITSSLISRLGIDLERETSVEVIEIINLMVELLFAIYNDVDIKYLDISEREQQTRLNKISALEITRRANILPLSGKIIRFYEKYLDNFRFSPDFIGEINRYDLSKTFPDINLEIFESLSEIGRRLINKRTMSLEFILETLEREYTNPKWLLLELQKITYLRSLVREPNPW